LLATRRRADSVQLQDFTTAVERIIAGLCCSMEWTTNWVMSPTCESDPRCSRPRTRGAPRGREFSDETERLIDHAVRDLVGHALQRAVAIITAHRAVHERTAQLLLDKETLEERDIEALRSQVSYGKTEIIPDAEKLPLESTRS
jgi:ATP-dependent Zn protease